MPLLAWENILPDSTSEISIDGKCFALISRRIFLFSSMDLTFPLQIELVLPTRTSDQPIIPTNVLQTEAPVAMELGANGASV